MRINRPRIIILLNFLAIILAFVFMGQTHWLNLLPLVFVHCDTMEGPVVKDAEIALTKKDVTPVLK